MKKLMQLSSLLVLTFGLNACLIDIDEKTMCQHGIEELKKIEDDHRWYSFWNNQTKINEISDARKRTFADFADACYVDAMTDRNDHKTTMKYLDFAFNGYVTRGKASEAVEICREQNERRMFSAKCDYETIEKIIMNRTENPW
jgi:hypothetical protein